MGKGIVSPADAASVHSINTEVQSPAPLLKHAYEDVSTWNANNFTAVRNMKQK